MKKIFLLILLFACLYFKSNAQFNKQWLVSGGFQMSNYNTKTNTTINNVKYSKNTSEYNFGLNAEIGYFIVKNVSISYNFIYQAWNDNGDKYNISSVRNGLFLNYYVPIKNGVYFTLGGAPFIESITTKTSTYNLDKSNKGALFTIGFNFSITPKDLIGTNIYRVFDDIPQDVRPKSGILINYKHLIDLKR
jgi:hypothetical protein